MSSHISSEDRIKTLEAQIEKLQARQAKLNTQLAQAEIDRWQGRIEDLELQIHLGAMETNDKLKVLLDQLHRRWADATAQLESTTSAATEGADAVFGSLKTAYKDIRGAMLETKNRIAS